MQQHPNWVEKYGRFELDMNSHLALAAAAVAAVPGLSTAPEADLPHGKEGEGAL
jgi:hypothetical protein